MFATERLTLRGFCESDMPDLMRMADDPEVQRFIWEDCIVPRTAKFEVTIRGWIC